MRCIVALLALISLLGIAAGQTIFTGEGYSASQLAFFNAPNVESFEPNVQKYWQTYVEGDGNMTAKGLTTNMDIWLNTFPYSFEKPIQIKSSSFIADAPSVSGLSQTEMNSMTLKKVVTFNFNPDMGWKYTPSDTTFSFGKATGAPAKDSKGQIISQGIISLFSI